MVQQCKCICTFIYEVYTHTCGMTVVIVINDVMICECMCVCMCCRFVWFIHLNVSHAGGPRRRMEKRTNHNGTLGRINRRVAWTMSCCRWGKYFIMSECAWVWTCACQSNQLWLCWVSLLLNHSFLFGSHVWFYCCRPGNYASNLITFHKWFGFIFGSTFQKLLCAYAFPRCTIVHGRPKMLPLCYEDCVATHQQFCYTDWILLEEKRDRGIPLKTRGHFRLPDCKSLPRYNSSTAAEHPICSYVGLTEMSPDDITCKSEL